jgi:hypothetical protein
MILDSDAENQIKELRNSQLDQPFFIPGDEVNLNNSKCDSMTDDDSLKNGTRQDNFLEELRNEEWKVEEEREDNNSSFGNRAPNVKNNHDTLHNQKEIEDDPLIDSTLLEEHIEEEEEEIIKIQKKKVRRILLIKKSGEKKTLKTKLK